MGVDVACESPKTDKRVAGNTDVWLTRFPQQCDKLEVQYCTCLSYLATSDKKQRGGLAGAGRQFH